MMFDSHIHSKNSPDSKQTLDEICLAAIEKGVKGIAITDHAHMSPAQARFFGEFDNYNNIKNSIDDTYAAREKYKDKLQIFCGIEIGEYLHDVAESERIMSLTNYDIIIGSVHYVEAARWNLAYSKIVFDETVSDDEITDYMSLYFDEILQMIDNVDFDVLAHLTCPLRYINGRHKRNYDISRFYDTIKEVLQKIIDKNIGLEVNTAGAMTAFGTGLCPEEEILKLYYDLGGRTITLGSDAHRSVNIALGFDEAIDILKKIGFEYYCYYEKREAKKVSI